MTHSHMFGSTDSADSAGQPWAGRSFEANPHSDDDGSAPAVLAQAQAAFVAGTGSLAAVVDAVRDARVLIPLVAVAGEVGTTAEGLTVDKTQELSVVTVSTPDGRTALPVFTSVAAMRQWNPSARPVPADGVRAALAAAGEQTPMLILDPATDHHMVLRRPAVWAIAKAEPWVAPELDPQIQAILTASQGGPVHRVHGHSGDPRSQLMGPDLEVELVLEPGLNQSELQSLLEQLTTAWFAEPVFAERVDQLGLRVLPAD